MQGAWYCAKAITIGNEFCNKAITMSRVDQILFPKLDRILYIKNGELSNMYIFDMMLYEYRTFSDNKITTNVKRFNSVKEYEDYDKEKTSYCNANFLGVQIKLVNPDNEKDIIKTYDINIENKNYYIEGNILFDKPFIKYIMYSQHRITLLNNKYIVSFFDNQLDHVSINENQYIQIVNENNFYTIKTI